MSQQPRTARRHRVAASAGVALRHIAVAGTVQLAGIVTIAAGVAMLNAAAGVITLGVGVTLLGIAAERN